MKITKTQLRKLIREAFVEAEKEPFNAPATSWELAMEKFYDMVEKIQKAHSLGSESLTSITKEYDQLESKAFHMKQSGMDVPSTVINKLSHMEKTIDTVRLTLRKTDDLLDNLKRFR